jgi:hypothetical protein
MCEHTINKQPIPPPNTAEELLEEKERRKRQSTGSEFQEDHIR